MRTIKFYRLETGKCPVEEFFDSLTNKQFEKIAFVLDLIEQIDIVPGKYFKKLKGTDDIWEARFSRAITFFGVWAFLAEKILWF